MSSHKPGVRTHVRPAHRDQAHPRLRQDAGLISGAIVGFIAQQPRPSGPAIRQFMHGCQVMHPCGQHLNAYGHAIRAADQMQTPSKELLPFGGAIPAEFAPGAFRQRRARTRRQTGRGRLSMMNTSPVVNTSPNTSGIQTIQSAS